MRPHGHHQLAAAGGQGDALADRHFGDGNVKTGEQRHPLAQGRLESDFAAHGAFGNGGDPVLQPDEIGEFVDALLADHGRIHVGEKQLLAPVGDRLDENIDRRRAQRQAQHVGGGAAIAGVGERAVGAIAMSGARCERNIRRLAQRENHRLARAGQTAGARGDQFWAYRLGAGGADQGCDMGHKYLNALELTNRPAVQALLIAGPTASGKSALAVDVAETIPATVINANSMQVYADLPIISARPAPEDFLRAPHLLFGHIDAERNYSVGQWRDDAAKALESCQKEQRLPIFVGGTGMYFKALLRGMSPIPSVPDEVRAQVRRECADVAPGELHARLAALDPETAARLRPTDPQRIVRALEIFAATGSPLARFQGAREKPLLDAEKCRCVFLAPERAALNARIDRRFEQMIEAGAVEEVRRLFSRALDPALPAMRAVGVPGLIDFLRGACSLDEAIARGQRDSRQYGKRQFTFARTQLPEFAWLEVD